MYDVILLINLKTKRNLMEPITSLPNEIWNQINLDLHIKSKLSQTCSFFYPIFQPYLKVTKSFFDVFDNLQSEYCEQEASCNASIYDEDKITNKIIYSKINPDDFSVLKLNFYPSLIAALPLLCIDLGVPLDNLVENCEKLSTVIQEGDFKEFEDAVKFIPVEDCLKVALASDKKFAEMALTLFDQIKQSDFVMMPVLDRIDECEDIEESLKSTCIGANTTKMDTSIYFIAKIQKINLIFRTQFCQKEILDAVELANKNLLKEFPLSQQ